MDITEHRRLISHEPTYVILGVQGSGTNLISRILLRAFGISVVKDRSLIIGVAGRMTQHPSQTEVARAMAQVCRRLFPNAIQRRLFARQWFHQAKRYSGIDKYIDPSSVTSPAEFADFFYDYHAWVAGCRHKGLKSDDCWQHLDRMNSVLPNRRYIFLVRDPRDNALSIMNKDFGPRTVYTAARFVKQQLAAYSREVRCQAQHSLVTTYETLLKSPDKFIREFEEFSGLRSTIPAEDVSELLKIRSANHSKWKRLHDRDIAVLESILNDELNDYGYDRGTTNGLPLRIPLIAKYRVKDVLLRIPQRLTAVWQHKVLAR